MLRGGVLILVLMEDTLRDIKLKAALSNRVVVLILVLMEDTLRAVKATQNSFGAES